MFIDCRQVASYVKGVTKPPSEAVDKLARRKLRPRVDPAKRPNRITELKNINNKTFEKIAEDLGVHSLTITKLATGKQPMTLAWMERLGNYFNVSPQEIVWAPPSDSLRKVRVTGALCAGAWEENHEWDADHQYDVMVPDVQELRGVRLYASEINGPSMNKRYPDHSVVILSPLRETYVGIKAGSRYHVRQTREDGLVEETIKTLVRDENGEWWLMPESTDPNYQQWLALKNGDGTTVEIIGRVEFAVQREP